MPDQISIDEFPGPDSDFKSGLSLPRPLPAQPVRSPKRAGERASTLMRAALAAKARALGAKPPSQRKGGGVGAAACTTRGRGGGGGSREASLNRTGRRGESGATKRKRTTAPYSFPAAFRLSPPAPQPALPTGGRGAQQARTGWGERGKRREQTQANDRYRFGPWSRKLHRRSCT